LPGGRGEFRERGLSPLLKFLPLSNNSSNGCRKIILFERGSGGESIVVD
jgi:hypothetical protein